MPNKAQYKIISHVLDREGGVLNDKADRGGFTNYGLTLPTLEHYNIDLNADGITNRADSLLLTRAKAREVYNLIFADSGASGLPVQLQESFFDSYVHSGNYAVRDLQVLLNGYPRYNLKRDSIIGKATYAAAKDAIGRAGDLIVDGYNEMRRDRLFRIADKDPSQRKWFRRQSDGGKGGWCKRPEGFIVNKRYIWSYATFAKKTRHWGAV